MPQEGLTEAALRPFAKQFLRGCLKNPEALLGKPAREGLTRDRPSRWTPQLRLVHYTRHLSHTLLGAARRAQPQRAQVAGTPGGLQSTNPKHSYNPAFGKEVSRRGES